jgi:hygromycin-B 7''-O-kinase
MTSFIEQGEFMTKFNTVLPHINSDEEYNQLNLNDDLFKNAAREIIARHNLPAAPLSLLEGTNIVFSYGGDRIVKIFPPMHHSQFMSESLVIKHLYNQLTITTPAIEFEGAISGWPYIIMSRLDGVPLERLWGKLDHHNKEMTIIQRSQ